MVRVLIALRRCLARHELAAASPVALGLTAVLAGASAVGTLVLGSLGYARQDIATDVLALLGALWVGGRLAQAALTGEPFLRPELFALLPIPRRRLAWSLLVAGLVDPANLVLAITAAALLAHGVRLGPAATVTAAGAMLLTVAVTSLLATVFAGLLGPGSRRGHDIGTVVTALFVSLLAMTGTLLPALLSALRHGTAPWLSLLLRVLPTGWGPVAVAAADRGDLIGVLGPLLGLVGLGAAAILTWPWVLSRRMQGHGSARRGSSVRPGGQPVLASTATGAVAVKEVRLWGRDPIRLTCLLIAFVVGTGVALVPALTSGLRLLQPFAGSITVVIAAACACNLYGNDGSSLWLTVMTPGSAKPDVRGRQLGWLLVVAPYAAASTVALALSSGQRAYWPWALALLLAVLGTGAGLAALASLIAVQPLDPAGNPTPAWSLKVHVSLLVVPLGALPTLLALFAGAGWLAVPVGAASGILAARGLGTRAAELLARRQVPILRTLTGGGRA